MSGSEVVPSVLPDMGRVYCNVLFDVLEKKDKVSYSWLSPDGVIFRTRTYLKLLGQRRTWSWNYLDISELRARCKPGRWQVEIEVNERSVGRIGFEMLKDVIESKEQGILPIIITIPYAYAGLDKMKCRGKFGEEAMNLSKIVASHLKLMFSCSPTVVICKIDPGLMDVDAAQGDAYIDPQLAPYYQSFYQTVDANIKRILSLQRRVPIVVNIKVHDEEGQTIHVGTLNGASLSQMNAHCADGDVRFTEHGVITRLRKWKVRPTRDHEPDDKRFTGGNILKTFTADGPIRVNGLELHLPRELCKGYGFRPLSKDIAEALACFYHKYAHRVYIEDLPHMT